VVLSDDSQQKQPERRRLSVVPDVHLRDYIAIVLQHIRLVVIVVIVALAMGAFKVWSAKPVYRASVFVRVGQQQGPQEFARDFSGWEREVSTYCRIIEGRDFAKRAVEKLGIASYGDLGLSKPEPGLVAKAKSWVVAHIPTSRSEEPDTDAFADVDPQRFSDVLRGKTNASPVGGTNLIQIRYSASNRDRASDICKGLADLFIETEHERHLDSSQRWIRWFREQQAEFQRKVADSEEELLDFHKEMDGFVNTLGGESEAGISVLQKTIETLEARQAEVRVERIQVETELTMLTNLYDSENPLPASVVVLETPAIEELLSTEQTLRRELAVYRMRYGPKHPRTVELQKALQMLADDMRAHTVNAMQARRERLNAIKIEERKLGEELRSAENKAREVNRQLVEYNALKRKAQVNWTFFDTFISRATEANLAATIDAVNIDLITSEPEVSRGAGRGIKTMLVALFVGLAAGIGLALFADYMDTTLATPIDLKRSLDLDQLAVLVHAGYGKRRSKGSPVLVSRDHPDEPLTENFRTLRANILFSPHFRGIRCIAVTSSVAQEGKSTVAGNLAVVLAQADKKVLLVDSDLRRPSVHKLFGCERKPGLSDFLQGKSGFDEVLHEGGVENLNILPCGSSVSKVGELLSATSVQFKELMQAAERFDYVLFDTPPMTLSDPTLVAKSTSASVILVIRSGAVSRDVVQRSVDKLRSVDADVAGVALNNFDLKRQGYYGYGYSYRYYDYYPSHYRYYSSGERERDGGGKEKSG